MNLGRTASIHSCFPEDFSLLSSTESQQNSPTAASSQDSHCITIAHDPVDENLYVGDFASVVSSLPSQETSYSIHRSAYPNTSTETSNSTPAASSQDSPLPAPPATPRNKTTTRLTLYVPLYQAALKGDWEKATEFLQLHPGAVSVRITNGMETVLHIAAGAKHVGFVEELVKLMSPTDLAFRNKDSNTAFCFAAASGITRIAEVMVNKNKCLPGIRGKKGVTPLHIAALLGHRDMVWYLFRVTDEKDLTQKDYFGILFAAISANLFDVALHIIRCHPELAIHQDRKGKTALHVLARKPSAFYSKTALGLWQRCIYHWIHVELPTASNCWSGISKYQSCTISQAPGIGVIYQEKLLHMQALELLKGLWEQFLLLDDSDIADLLRSASQPLFVAAELGIVEFVTELIRSYPDLIWKVDEQSRTIFHIAVMHRQEKIFNLIHDIGAHKDMISSYKDINKHNLLHLAGKLAPLNQLNIVSGAALQMQRELLWFREVEKIMQPLCKEMRDTKGKTPQMLFIEEHKGLVKGGEKWMKNTGSSCMLVATLITTVMFAAIFTVPGGNNNEIGTPIFLQTTSFIIFSISDALALFSSVTSILMFLSILTSRYAEEDFLNSLPRRLIIGLVTLFFSIASMLVAFGATFFIVIGQRLAWIVVPVAVVACIPVTIFGFLQFSLLVDMIHSSYGAGIFKRKRKDMLY